MIVRAKDRINIRVEKRRLGYRLDPTEQHFRTEFDGLFFYDDVHLLKRDEQFVFHDKTWQVLRTALSKLFDSSTMDLLSIYHHEMADIVVTSTKLGISTSSSVDHRKLNFTTILR